MAKELGDAQCPGGAGRPQPMGAGMALQGVVGGGECLAVHCKELQSHRSSSDRGGYPDLFGAPLGSEPGKADSWATEIRDQGLEACSGALEGLLSPWAAPSPLWVSSSPEGGLGCFSFFFFFSFYEGGLHDPAAGHWVPSQQGNPGPTGWALQTLRSNPPVALAGSWRPNGGTTASQ